MRVSRLALATLVAGAFLGAATTSAQTLGSAITYQGTFADAGVPANAGPLQTRRR